MPPKNTLLSLIRAHPYQTALHAINGAIFLEPRIITVPTFWAVGFEKRGPRKDSIASAWMRFRDCSSTQTLYATVQSAAMGGRGVDTMDAVMRVGAVVLSVAVWRRGRR